MKNSKMSACTCSKAHIPEAFLPMPVIPFSTYRKYRPEYIEVDTLLDLCSIICDASSEPVYWHCSPEEIAYWILEGTDHPEYKEAFVKNRIDGKGIVFLEADKFPRISIRNFDVIKELTARIRKFCGVDLEEYHRSISLPYRRPQTLYLLYKAKRTGPTAYYMTLDEYFKLIHIIPEEEACGRSYYALKNHWNRIPPFMPWCPHIMIGKDRRINPMTGTTQRQNFYPKNHPYLLKEDALCRYKVDNKYKFPVGKDVEIKPTLKKVPSIPVCCES